MLRLYADIVAALVTATELMKSLVKTNSYFVI